MSDNNTNNSSDNKPAGESPKPSTWPTSGSNNGSVVNRSGNESESSQKPAAPSNPNAWRDILKKKR